MPQFLADSPCPKLPDWIPKVLAGNPHCGPCHADHGGGFVVQLEDPVIDIYFIEFEIICKIVDQVSHLEFVVPIFWSEFLSSPLAFVQPYMLC